jgi:density-regulated protein DRP1
MGKKKNKGKAAEEDPETNQEEEETTPDVSDGAPPTEKSSSAETASAGASVSGSDAADADADAPSMRAGAVVAGTAETRFIPNVAYCPVSSLPFEFCEWDPQFKKCKANFEENWKTYYPDVEGDEELAALMSRLGFEGGDEASRKAQKSKKEADPDKPPQAPGKVKDKGQAVREIVIELNNRNKKKHITTVKGLEHFHDDPAAAAKLFGKRFACGSALKKGQNGQPDQIEIQGSCRDELPSVMVDKLKLSIENIVIIIDGKKHKAADAPTS